MKKYIVSNLSNPEKLAIVGASGVVPQNVICELPAEFYNEDQEWLSVSGSLDEFGNEIKVVSINEELKQLILQERQLLSEQQNRLQLRTRKRNFGENLIDQISLINESNEVDLETLETIITDPDLIVIREFLWTGSIKSAYTKMLSIELKIQTLFGELSYTKIKAEVEAFLASINEL